MKGLITYLEIGHGFKSPAIAIGEELKKLNVEVDMIDLLAEINSKFLDRVYKEGWNFCLKYPYLFDLLYKSTNKKYRLPEFLVLNLLERKILDKIKDINPDFILSTHFTTTYFYSNLIKKNKLKIPLFAYNSDVLISHSYWISNKVEAYYVSTKEGFESMIENGQDKKNLVLSSFPIDKKFKKKFDSKIKEREKLHLKDDFTGLLVLGGTGIGNAVEVIKNLENADIEMQLIIVCGKNQKLKKELESIQEKLKNISLIVLDFINNMEDYIYCSDVVIGKAGLNLLFETIYMKKPFIVCMAMANEKFAADYVKKNEIGYWPKNIQEIPLIIKNLKNSNKDIIFIQKNIEQKDLKFNTEEIAKDIIYKSSEFIKNKNKIQS